MVEETLQTQQDYHRTLGKLQVSLVFIFFLHNVQVLATSFIAASRKVRHTHRVGEPGLGVSS